MRDSSRRTEKYRKKIRGLVIPGQTARYAPTAQDRLHLEYCVKREAITPMLQFSYVAFCEELLKHEASKRPVEAQGIYNKWLNRGLDATTLQSVASCIGVSIVIPAPPICAWSWKRKLTFSGNVSATNLDDFPVLVHLTVANFDFNKAQNNGEDIRFMNTDTCPSDGTPLKHEIELWDKAGLNAWIWVMVPRIDGGSVIDFIYMFYGNGAAADGQDVNGTWNAAYRQVFHLRGDGTANIPDSSLPTLNGTKAGIGSPANLAASHIDGGQRFDGINDHVAGPYFDLSTSDFTIEMWFNTTQAIQALLWGYYRAAPHIDVGIWINMGYAGEARVDFRVAPQGCWTATTFPFVVNDGSWHHVACVRDGNNLRIYVDGVLISSCSGVAGMDISPATGARLGERNDGTQDYDGDMDEFRISNTNRSGDWLMATVRSGNETLVTYGAEEPA